MYTDRLKKGAKDPKENFKLEHQKQTDNVMAREWIYIPKYTLSTKYNIKELNKRLNNTGYRPSEE